MKPGRKRDNSTQQSERTTGGASCIETPSCSLHGWRARLPPDLKRFLDEMPEAPRVEGQVEVVILRRSKRSPTT